MTASKTPPPRRQLLPINTLLTRRQSPYGDIPETLKLPRHGKWLPGDIGLIQKWVHDMILHVEANPQPFRPVFQEFQKVIKTDLALYMVFITMFKEIPAKYKDPIRGHLSSKWRKVQDYVHMLQLFNYILTTAPAFNDSGMVGVPINAVLDGPMGTKAGNAAFLNPKVNEMFKKMLDEWARFLGSPDFTSVLHDKKDGWFSPHALEAMRHAARGSEKWKFEDEYICDPKIPHYGFKSWDDFFIKRFKEGVRPVAYKDDDNVIVNAC